MKKPLKNKLLLIFVSLLLFFSFFSVIANYYTDLLWFDALGFSHTFWVIILSRLGLRVSVTLIFILFIFFNLMLTRKTLINYINIKKNNELDKNFTVENEEILEWFNPKRLGYTYLLISIIFGFLFSLGGQEAWQIVLRYFNSTSFAKTDPIFNKDISFYVFKLPFYNFLKEMGMTAVILTFILVAFIYILASGIKSLDQFREKLLFQAKVHKTFLLIIFFLLKAWDYRLQIYRLLFSDRGVAFGASYTDINATLTALNVLFYLVIILAVILTISIFIKNYRPVVWGVGIWILSIFLLGFIYPAFVQNFRVEPNELALESEYIQYNIDLTGDAYGLSKIKNIDFTVDNDLKLKDLENNEATINNIRLWDSRPLLSTYRQLQELRQYYKFVNVDIDRYQIGGEYRQVMLAAREMDQSLLSLPAQTWVNQTLKYTHGYGLVMSPVNKLTTEGLPELYIKDIPPQSVVDINIENPAIYYGEKTENYVIANNKTQEFHYPQGSENVYKNYQGDGGVVLNSFFKKILYALRFQTFKILLAEEIGPQSQIMYFRNIHQRVRKIAPFLKFDSNPYLVLADQRLFWIQDAYTATNNYPYSQPLEADGEINYIRNSIKIVIDAYHGRVKFYVIDHLDPLLKTYQKIFPDLFSPISEMPTELFEHLRYPEDLFEIQSRIYGVYHMTDPVVFYNKEAVWEIPEETYASSSIKMKPYYIIIQLPGERKEEFVLMRPLTPVGKNNMIAWMAARCDGENYGELIAYKFSKQLLVYGPMQIESRIDQDTFISQRLSLWSQRGSRVIRGNLLIIPIENSIIYVEPIYLQAETSEIPEMKRVVISYNERLVMAETLELALEEIFSREVRAVEDREEDLELDQENQYEELLDELENIIEELRKVISSQN